MSIVHATLPLRVRTHMVPGTLQGDRYGWTIRTINEDILDECPAIYRHEAAAMNAGRAAAYRYAQRACEEAAGWK